MPFCAKCGNEVAGDDEYCSRCGNHLKDGCRSETEVQSDKDAGRAVLFGLLTPGGGYLYLGNTRKWIIYQILIVVIFLVAVAVLLPSFGTQFGFGGGVLPIVILLLILSEGIYLYALYGGYRSAKRK